MPRCHRRMFSTAGASAVWRSISLLLLAARAASCSAVCGAGTSADTMPSFRRPNVLMLQADSMDGRLMDPSSPYWNKADLPTLHALAAGGINFASHYTNSPQCVPSRTSMITSRYVHDSKTWNNGMGIARSTATGKLDSNCVGQWSHDQCAAFARMQGVNATMFDALQAVGYEVSIIGRVDMGNGLLDEYSEASGDGFHGGPSLPILSRAADIRRPITASPLSMVDDDDNGAYASDEDHVTKAVTFLEGHALNSTTPFFFLFGILAPHPPYDTNATYLAAVNESNVDVPPVLDIGALHPYDSYMTTSKNVSATYSDEQIKSIRRSYWAAYAQADSMFGTVLEAARRTGHLDNTIVVFTSDHGELAMEHIQDYKNALYEPSTRVPLVVTGFNVTVPVPVATTIHNLTSHLDLVPTLMEWAGGPSFPGSRGYPLTQFMSPNHDTVPITGSAIGLGRRCDVPVHPPYIASEYHSNYAPTGAYMLRQGQWKYITYGRNFAAFANYSDQLFNLDVDPFELDNVAAANPTVAQAMQATLKAEFANAEYAGLQEIDLAAKLNDYTLYQTFFADVNNASELRVRFERAYEGFDDVDAAKVTAWIAQAGAAAALR